MAGLAAGWAPALAAGPGADPLVAVTPHGPVHGRRQGDVLVFKGVRYGADTATTRFQAPRPPAPWRAVVDAGAYGPGAPQTPSTPTAGEAFAEDCLFLNVWTPALRDGGRRPVMVYIHGGAYSHGSGSSPLYDGSALVRRGDVVVVTLNHRLNAFGYLSLGRVLDDPSFADAGNAGMLDLVLALEWVRDAITEFGGDPGRVMLFGQSGGGAKIATLMAMPAARGLFHRVATMSGQQVTASGPLHAEARARAYLRALGLDPGASDLAGRLRALPAAALLAAQSARDPIEGGGLYFGPVVDDRALPRHPFYPDAPPLSAEVPMIIGNTHDETRMLIGAGDPTTFSLDWAELPGRLARSMRADLAPERVVATYRRLYPHYSASDVFFAATTAGRSWRGAVIEVEARARQAADRAHFPRAAATYAYQLDWPSPLDGGKWGAPHTLDIALVFGTLAVPGALTGTGEAARALSARMADAFIAFARHGVPAAPGLPTWAPYDLERRATLVFNDTCRLVDDPRGEERRLFAAVPFIQSGT